MAAAGLRRGWWLNTRRHLEQTQSWGSQLAVEGLMQEGLVQFLQGAEELIGQRVEVFAALKMPAGLWLLQGWR